MKRLLYLSYYFPPVLNVAALRAKRFVRYLPEYGWDPVVLALAPRPDQPVDEALCRSLPAGVPVLRVKPPGERIHRARQRLRQGSRGDRLAASVLGMPARFSSAGPPLTLSVLLRALWAVRRYEPKLTFASFGPSSALWVAQIIRRVAGVPYVVEFRDPWVGNEYSDRLRGRYLDAGHLGNVMAATKRARQALRGKAAQERRLVEGSAGLATIGGPLGDMYLRRYPSFLDRSLELPHGYDEADLPAPVDGERQPSSCGNGESLVRFCYTGHLHRFQRADALFEAISRAMARNAGVARRLRFTFVGNVYRSYESRIRSSPALSSVIELTGVVPHEQALRAASAADALLSIHGPMLWEQTGKMSEYIALGKPIVCLSDPRSGAAQLVAKTGTGKAFHPDDVDSLAQFLADVAGDPARVRSIWHPDEAAIHALSSSRLTEQLARFLDRRLEESTLGSRAETAGVAA